MPHIRRLPRGILAACCGVAVAPLIATSATTAAASAASGPSGPAGSDSTTATDVGQLATQFGATPAFPRASTGPIGSATDSLAIERLESSLDGRLAGPRAGKSMSLQVPGLPVVAPSPVGGTTSLAASFEAINAYQNSVANVSSNFGPEPPDQGLCAGNGMIMEAVNDSIRVFGPNGQPLTDTVSLNDFYGYPPAVNPKTGRHGPELTDPSCIYDAGSNRFFVVELTLATNPKTGALTGPNSLDLAVSHTGDPRGGYNLYRLPVQDDGTQGTPKHPSCPCIGDYPQMAADRNGIYVTTNEFPLSGAGKYGGYNGVQLYAFSKAALVSFAHSVSLVHFADISTGRGSNRLPAYHVWAARVPGASYATGNRGTEYLMGSEGGFFSPAHALQFWRLTNTSSLNAAHPQLTLSGSVVGSETYFAPPLANQRVGPTPLADCINTACVSGVGPGSASEGPLATNDPGLQQVYFADGRLFSALDTAGVVSRNLQSAVAWFVVAPGSSGSGPRVTNQGYVGATNTNLLYPAVAARSDGTGVLAFSLAGRAFYPSSAYMLVTGGGPAGSINIAGAGVAPEDGHCEYAFFNCAGSSPPSARPRWGDYSSATVLGRQLVLATEYIGHTCSFVTFEHDQTCGHTRVIRANWDTRISRVTP